MSYPGRSPVAALGRRVRLKTAGERVIALDRTGEVSRGHSTGDYSTEFLRSECLWEGPNGTPWNRGLKEESSYLKMDKGIASEN